jgi:hypothetical protein
MVPVERPPFWTTQTPTKWPAAPDEMTVTTLADIEACPRRWALSAAEYSGLWSGRGYPPRPQLNALAGTVVHLALETIMREFVRAQCFSIEDAKVPQVLRSLGGYTRVIHDSIDRVLDRLILNPRGLPLIEAAARALRGQASKLRIRTQTILSRLRLPGSVAMSVSGSGPMRRAPLSIGAYPEIQLHARRIGWKGKADLITLSDEACEISDFKTGAQDDSHGFQIRVYALLWRADEELNPSQRLADRLLLRYGSVDVEVPAPTASELDNLERDLVARTDAARRAVSAERPKARPSSENCRFCGVRQLCGEYWEAATQQALGGSGGADRRFTDVELTVTGRHGPSSWDAVIEIARDAGTGKPAVLRTKENQQFQPGERLRVLDAALAVDVEVKDQPAVITLGTMSETYAVT